MVVALYRLFIHQKQSLEPTPNLLHCTVVHCVDGDTHNSSSEQETHVRYFLTADWLQEQMYTLYHGSSLVTESVYVNA